MAMDPLHFRFVELFWNLSQLRPTLNGFGSEMSVLSSLKVGEARYRPEPVPMGEEGPEKKQCFVIFRVLDHFRKESRYKRKNNRFLTHYSGFHG